MGRTVLPFNQVLEQEFRSWAKFRRALRKEDQEAFDALFGAAKYHVAAASYASQLNPLEAIFLSILIEHQKTLDALNARLARPAPGESADQAPRADSEEKQPRPSPTDWNSGETRATLPPLFAGPQAGYRSTMLRELEIPREQIADFCRRWKIAELALFGSAPREDRRPHSDVDVLVTFQPDAGWSLWDLVNMQEELQKVFGREVDLVEPEGLRNPFRRREILKTRRVIYAA